MTHPAAYIVEYVDAYGELNRRVYHSSKMASNAVVRIPSCYRVETRPIGEPIPFLSRKGRDGLYKADN